MSDLKYSIELDADTKSVKIAESDIKSFDERLKKIGVGKDGLNDLKVLIDEIERAGGEVGELKKRYEQLAGSWHALNAQEQSQRIRRIRESILGLGFSAEEAARSSRNLSQSINQTSSSFGKLKTKIKALAAAMGVTFVASKVTSFFGSAIKGAADFEQQLATVQAVSGATVEEMAQIKTKSEELGKSTRYTATQAAEGFEILARAGLNTSQSLETIDSVLALAQGNSLELSEAADFVTSAVQGMGLAFSDTGRVADVLAKTASSAKTDVQGLGSALSYAAPSAHALGLSLEETAAYIGKFADAGIDASRAGTSLNGMLSQFGNSTSSFRRELAKIGIVTDDFNQAIHELAKSGDRGQAAINALGTEAGPALKALLSQGMGSLDNLIGKLNKAGGTAQEQADVMNNTWQGALASLQSAWDSLKNKLGESFLSSMTEDFKDLSEQIVALVDSGKIKELGDGLANLFHEAMQKLLAFSKSLDMQEILSKTADAFATLQEFGRALSVTLSSLNIGFQVFKEGVLSIGTVVAQFIENQLQNFKTLLDVANTVGKAFGSDALDGYVQAIDNAIAFTKEFKNNAIDGMTKANESIARSWDNITEQATQSTQQTATALETIPQSVQENVQKSADIAKQAVDELKDEAAQKAEETKQAIATTFESLKLDVNQSLTGIHSETQQTFDMIANGAKAVGESTYSAAEKTKLLASLFEKGLNAAKTKEEFEALDKIAKEYQLTNQATSEQMKTLQAGIEGGSEAVKKLKDELEKQNKALDDNAKSTKENAHSKKELAQASNEATQAEAQHTQAQSNSLAIMQQAVQTVKDKIKALQGEAATVASVDAQYQKLLDSIGATNKQYLSMADFAQDMERMNAVIEKQTQHFNHVKNSVLEHTQALSKAEISSNDLAAAQLALDKAISMSNDGMMQLDSQTLDGLKSAIDSARAKMQSLADDAKKTADALEESLAKMKGDDDTARRLEQTKKLTDLTDKLNEAKKRGNQDEIKQLERALELQKQINAEENRKVEKQRQEKKQQAQKSRTKEEHNMLAEIARLKNKDIDAIKIQQAQKEKDIQDELTKARQKKDDDEIAHLEQKLKLQQKINDEELKKAEQSAKEKADKADKERTSIHSSSSGSGSISNQAAEMADIWDERIKQAEERGAMKFAQQLRDEAKRRAM